MPHTILVIDNDPVQIDTVGTVLREKLGYQVMGVPDSRQAIHYIESTDLPKPDLILFDVSNAEPGFTAAIADLRTLTLHMPIIALVRYGDYATANAALGSGAQDFLSKPIATDRLKTTIANMLRLRDAQREISYIRHEQIHDLHSVNGAQQTASQQVPAFSLVGDDGNIRRMEQIEAAAIRFAMQHYKGRMTEVARRLGIGRSTLYRKLSELMVRQQEAA
jgi:DNA-binding NtrC family response regulator